MESKILVAGATGGVGEQIVRQLLAHGRSVRILVRDEAKATKLFADTGAPGNLEIVVGDVRRPETLGPAFAGVSHVMCTTGSRAPIGGNAPKNVDYEGVSNLVDAAKGAGVTRFLLVSSMSVTKPNHFLNAFGQVLTWKLRGENVLRASGLPYTIVRPGGLKDDPGGVLALHFDQGDRIGTGMISRADVATVCLQALGRAEAVNTTFEVINKEGAPPDASSWDALFATLQPDAAVPLPTG